jgi:hypothetical protein
MESNSALDCHEEVNSDNESNLHCSKVPNADNYGLAEENNLSHVSNNRRGIYFQREYLCCYDKSAKCCALVEYGN